VYTISPPMKLSDFKQQVMWAVNSSDPWRRTEEVRRLLDKLQEI